MNLLMNLPMAMGLCLVATITPCAAESPAKKEPLPLKLYLPVGDVEVEFMMFAMSPRAEEITLKLTASIAKHREWFAQYMAEEVEPGKPMPYHPNFGITELEYKELIDDRARNPHVSSRGIKKTIRITQEAEAITFRPIGWSMPQLETLAINIKDKTLSSGKEAFGKAEWDVKRNGGGAFGPWRGYQWKIQPELSLETAKAFLLGKAQDRLEEASLDLLSPFGTDYVYFYFRRRVFAEGEQQRIDILFRYPSPELPKQPLPAEESSSPRTVNQGG